MNRESAYYPLIGYFILFFFFNNFLLPQGLLFTTLLVPVFLYWLYKREKIKNMMKWAVLLVLPVPFQLMAGVDAIHYIISSAIVFSSWIFLFTALEAVKRANDDMEHIFLTILKINSVLFALALILLPFEETRGFMWDTIPMSKGIASIPRLKLLAYEPSHYGLLLSPVIIYFFLKIITGQAKHPLILALGAGIPLLATLSFGIIGALLIMFLISFAAFFRHFSLLSRRLILYSLAGLIVLLLALWMLWPDNPLFIRLGNIIAGTDSSSKGRLIYSFMFARDLILQHNVWTGVGPGQIKILAHDLIVNFYKYTGDYAEIVRIPNSMGEMLATYGIYGFILKIFFSIYFFIRLKIYNNLYTFSLFIFIFIYQFTGSFLVNAAEIGVWAFIFAGKFTEFNLVAFKKEEI